LNSCQLRTASLLLKLFCCSQQKKLLFCCSMAAAAAPAHLELCSPRQMLPALVVLSSGTLQRSSRRRHTHTFFSYVCHLVGHLARSFHTDLLIKWDDEASTPRATRTSESLLFGRLLFLCFICELVPKCQNLLAGFIISKWIHTHSIFIIA
jgi:hypothetical protein